MDKVNKLKEFDIEKEVKELAYKIPELNGREEIIKDYYKYIKPMIFWLDMDIEKICDDGLILKTKQNSQLEIKSKYIAGEFSNCIKATLIATTIGSDISIYSKDCHNKGQYLESILLDTVGSHSVEVLIEKFHNFLAQRNLNKGLYSVNRYSPGYGDWSLSQ